MTANTIFALASGRPPAGVAVIRISGPAAAAALEALTGAPRPTPRVLLQRTLRDPANAAVLDRALVVYFARPASATGEDAAELHLHGGAAVVAAVLGVLTRLPDLRLAEPGEFTRRAFDNGKLDLSQVEGLADLIQAQTEAQRVQALEQVRGGLRERVERWSAALLEALAGAEAALDFADEQEDVAQTIPGTVLLEDLRREIAAELGAARRGERLRDGLTIAVVGAPNVGKSSIINTLAQRQASIVSEHAGTTRDVIELHLDLEGLPMTLLDTAGLRDAVDPVERIGIERARDRAAAADLVLHIATAPVTHPLGQVVVNKIDKTNEAPGYRDNILFVSAQSGAGMNSLLSWLSQWARATLRPHETSYVTRLRQRAALEDVVGALDLALQAEDELRAEALRAGVHALGRISGRVEVDAVLDLIFARFCIGK